MEETSTRDQNDLKSTFLVKTASHFCINDYEKMVEESLFPHKMTQNSSINAGKPNCSTSLSLESKEGNINPLDPILKIKVKLNH